MENKYFNALYTITEREENIEETTKRYIEDYGEHPTQVLINLINSYEKLIEDLNYLKKEDYVIYHFPNGRKIFGIDITDMPSEKEKRKEQLDKLLNQILKGELNGKL
jgi:hypothetical protein